MAHMDIHHGYSVNGGGCAPAEILKVQELKLSTTSTRKNQQNERYHSVVGSSRMPTKTVSYLDEILGREWHHEGSGEL